MSQPPSNQPAPVFTGVKFTVYVGRDGSGDPVFHAYQVDSVGGLRKLVEALKDSKDEVRLFSDMELRELNQVLGSIVTHTENIKRLRGGL